MMRVKGGVVPSIELQTVEFVEAARALGGARAIELHYGGFRVELEYQSGFFVPGFGDFRGVLIIRRVFVPVRHRERGWLWAYLTMCSRIAEDAIFISCIKGDVRDLFVRRGFEAVSDDLLMRRR